MLTAEKAKCFSKVEHEKSSRVQHSYCLNGAKICHIVSYIQINLNRLCYTNGILLLSKKWSSVFILPVLYTFI